MFNPDNLNDQAKKLLKSLVENLVMQQGEGLTKEGLENMFCLFDAD